MPLAVEHWDNLQRKHSGPNPSGHTMIDGPTEATDLDRTEVNRELVKSFVDEVLINGQLDKLEHYIDAKGYTEHNPLMSDGLQELRTALSTNAKSRTYDKHHFMFAEGSFVLSVCEGSLDGAHSSFYDLFRVADDKLVEHWDTIDAVPPRSEWKNENGKF